MLIQVINLEKDKNRFDWMTKSLSDLGLSFIRVDAVRPDSIQGHDDRYTALLNQGLFPGEICCSLSHLQSWQNLVNSKDEFGSSKVIFFRVKRNRGVLSSYAGPIACWLYYVTYRPTDK